MTIKELIEELKKYPENLIIVTCWDDEFVELTTDCLVRDENTEIYSFMTEEYSFVDALKII